LKAGEKDEKGSTHINGILKSMAKLQGSAHRWGKRRIRQTSEATEGQEQPSLKQAVKNKIQPLSGDWTKSNRDTKKEWLTDEERKGKDFLS